MFLSRFPCLPLPSLSAAALEGGQERVRFSEGARVPANGSATPGEPPGDAGDASRGRVPVKAKLSDAERRARAAAKAREWRARRRAEQEAAVEAESASEPEPEPRPEPVPARLCQRCNEQPVAGTTARFCVACRKAVRNETVQRQKPARPELAEWPPAVAELNGRLHELQDRAEVADPDALPAINSAIRATAAKLEEVAALAAEVATPAS